MHYILENRFERDGLEVNERVLVTQTLMMRALQTAIKIVDENIDENFCFDNSESIRENIKLLFESTRCAFINHSEKLNAVTLCFLNIHLGQYVEIWIKQPERTVDDLLELLRSALKANDEMTEDMDINKLTHKLNRERLAKKRNNRERLAKNAT